MSNTNTYFKCQNGLSLRLLIAHLYMKAHYDTANRKQFVCQIFSA